jgi:hypothetical protein
MCCNSFSVIELIGVYGTFLVRINAYYESTAKEM